MQMSEKLKDLNEWTSERIAFKWLETIQRDANETRAIR